MYCRLLMLMWSFEVLDSSSKGLEEDNSGLRAQVEGWNV